MSFGEEKRLNWKLWRKRNMDGVHVANLQKGRQNRKQNEDIAKPAQEICLQLKQGSAQLNTKIDKLIH